MTKGRLCHVPANFTGMGRGSTQEPPRCVFEISIHCTVFAIWNQFGHLRFVSLHQNLPQSKDVESILVTFRLHDRRHHRRRRFFIG